MKGNHETAIAKPRPRDDTKKSTGCSSENLRLCVRATKHIAIRPLEITDVWPKVANGQKRRTNNDVPRPKAVIAELKLRFFPVKVKATRKASGGEARKMDVMFQ
jgi:hypothetical protein